jgi:hypothetical protein
VLDDASGTDRADDRREVGRRVRPAALEREHPHRIAVKTYEDPLFADIGGGYFRRRRFEIDADELQMRPSDRPVGFGVLS